MRVEFQVPMDSRYFGQVLYWEEEEPRWDIANR
jgi:hypothetical protein